MSFPLHLVLAAAVLVSSPGFAAADAGPSKAQVMADLYGRILGAASQCRSIAAGRVEEATASASAHLKAISRDHADTAAAGQRLLGAVGDGKEEVASGRTTCVQAAAELDNLEHELSSQPLRLPKTRKSGTGD